MSKIGKLTDDLEHALDGPAHDVADKLHDALKALKHASLDSVWAELAKRSDAFLDLLASKIATELEDRSRRGGR